MADKRISQLNQHTTPSGSDLLVIVNNNETKKITYADLVVSLTGSETDLSSLNAFTASYFTSSASFDSRVDILENWSSSLTNTFATDLEVQIVSSSVAATIGIVSQATGLVSTSSFNSFTQSIDSRIDSLENKTGSFATTGSNLFVGDQNISGSIIPAISGTYDLGSVNNPWRHIYVNTGSIFLVKDAQIVKVLNTNTIITTTDIASGSVNLSTTLPSGIISGSSQLTSSFDTRYLNTGGDGVISGSSQLTSSYDTRYAPSASYLTSLNGTISGSSQLTSSFDSRYVLSGSITQTTWDNIASKPSGIISGSSQLTTFETKGSGIYSSSAQLPSGIISGSSQLPTGLISGSSQLTSSYDTRYTLSGSVVSGTTPAGTISGSSQLTSSFDGRYTQTGSFNTLTASFNSFTASAQSVTTGSNSFNGTQTITGSLIITTGSFIGSQITANTASLYLTSGSNMYVQNNGVVEITGSLIVSGSAAFNVNVLSVNGRSGDEGGEIQLAIPETNTTLQNRVTVDLWRNRLRIFEGSAGANGVYIDLSKPTGNNNEITYKASGLVNAGDFVQLDNIKATITTTGNRGLSLATISGTFACNIAGNYAGAVVGASGTSGTATITTSASTSIFGWGFTTQGDIATYIITDTTNSRAYRITIQIGGSYINNLVSIERLH
jgi:hypothetical protein